MGRPARWRSTRKRVDFAPTTTTTMTIEPDGALVLLPESARAGERRRLKPSPLDSTTAASKTPQPRSILSVFKSTECSVAHRGRRSGSLSCNAPAGGFRVCGLQRGKGEDEAATAARIVCDVDTATMRSHDFADDGEAEAGAFLLFAPAAPEPFENVLSILWRNAAAAIGHLNPAGAVDR